MTELIGSEIFEEEEDTQKDKYLSFKLGNESYGIEIKYVTEIIGLQPFTEVPELPEYIRGIINLRGKIIPVMDVRLRFKKDFNEYNDRTCIVVIDINDINLGLIVDRVADVHTIQDTNIVPPPDMCVSGNRFIKGIGRVNDEVELLLDCAKLLKDEETELISNI
jgi:purine-binding chemotaxis protein CheW